MLFLLSFSHQPLNHPTMPSECSSRREFSQSVSHHRFSNKYIFKRFYRYALKKYGQQKLGICESRAQVLIGVLSPIALCFIIFLVNLSSMYGPFLDDLDIFIPLFSYPVKSVCRCIYFSWFSFPWSVYLITTSGSSTRFRCFLLRRRADDDADSW